MNIVYQITFIDREKKRLLPFKYIGSKTCCFIEKNKIFGKRGLYQGSSRDILYKNLIKNGEKYKVDVLYQCENYDDLLINEARFQVYYDVVANTEYFNKSIAMKNTYSDPLYATYKNLETGKIARLPRTHHAVIEGLWVGITKGMNLSEQHKKHLSEINSGSNNNFFNKHHTVEAKEKISIKNKVYYQTDKGIKTKNNTSKRIKQIMTNVPKTEEHKKKIGIKSKGKCVLKNINTGQCIKINCNDAELYNKNVWMNPSKINQKRVQCQYCGIISVVGLIKRWHNDNCKERFK